MMTVIEAIDVAIDSLEKEAKTNEADRDKLNEAIMVLKYNKLVKERSSDGT